MTLGDVIPLNSKLVCLGKVRGDNVARPIKIIFENNESASSVYLSSTKPGNLVLVFWMDFGWSGIKLS